MRLGCLRNRFGVLRLIGLVAASSWWTCACRASVALKLPARSSPSPRVVAESCDASVACDRRRGFRVCESGDRRRPHIKDARRTTSSGASGHRVAVSLERRFASASAEACKVNGSDTNTDSGNCWLAVPTNRLLGAPNVLKRVRDAHLEHQHVSGLAEPDTLVRDLGQQDPGDIAVPTEHEGHDRRQDVESPADADHKAHGGCNEQDDPDRRT